MFCDRRALRGRRIRYIATEVAPEPAVQGDGVLNVRYIPGVDAESEPDSMGPVPTPSVGGVDVIRQATAKGRVRFVRSTWEQLPTSYNIVDVLEQLPVVGYGECAAPELRRNIENRGQRSLV